MKIVILDRATIGLDTPLDSLNAFGDVICYDNTDQSEIFERVVDADIIILNKVKITDNVLRAAKKLKLICIFATGYDNVDLDAARAHNVAVCNVPGYSTYSVATLTITMALNLLTHIDAYNAFVRSGEYTSLGLPNRLTPIFNDLTNKTWGIIGCGNIGNAVAATAKALGAKIITHQRSKHPLYDTVTLDELCAQSDVISIHCPLTAETRGLISERELSLMKPEAILLNLARGAVLDEAAVARAIIGNTISGFACDVYSIEPFGEEHPYYQIKSLSNVILTPHCAWGSFDARKKCIEIINDNITSFLCNKTLNRVDIIGQK